MTGPLFEDRQTINVLVLELATMVVAIALTFSASFLTVFRLEDVVIFVASSVVVIWFWWDYVMDRLRYPPLSTSFPYLDVLVLISISIIPFAVRENSIAYVSGVISFLLVVWALMMSRIVSERGSVMSTETASEIRDEVVQRASVGLLMIGVALLGIYSTFFATLMLAFLVSSLIALNINERRQRRAARLAIALGSKLDETVK